MVYLLFRFLVVAFIDKDQKGDRVLAAYSIRFVTGKTMEENQVVSCVGATDRMVAVALVNFTFVKNAMDNLVHNEVSSEQHDKTIVKVFVAKINYENQVIDNVHKVVSVVIMNLKIKENGMILAKNLGVTVIIFV